MPPEQWTAPVAKADVPAADEEETEKRRSRRGGRGHRGGRGRSKGSGEGGEKSAAPKGGYSGGNLAMATRLMTVLGFTIIFNALVLVSTAIMQAHGHAGRPVINMLIGGVVNLVAVYVLAGMPLINILGTPIGLLMGYVVISILNILSMRRLLPKPPAILPNLLRSFFAAAVMGVLAWGALWALKAIGVREIGTGRLILCAMPVLVGVVSYFFTAVKFKVITHEDCLLLPKGEKIAKILKL